jgi:ABC-type Zn uptake system ZnuABC Zn-binding protein ZnuA
MHRWRLRGITIAIVLLFTSALHAVDGDSAVVITANQATYSLASALTLNTPIRVVNVPEDGRQLSLLKDYIARRAERLEATFASATAVISLTNALPEDPIYRFARDANIRIVNIDAALPWSLDSAGVALIETPASNVAWGADTDASMSATAPYFWLSVSNTIRMADIIAHDLGELFPDSLNQLHGNLDDLKWSLLNLRNEYQSRLIEADSDTVFALASDFVYLTNDMGLYVDGYFIKQDIRWTDADLANLTAHLRQNEIKAVIHKWLPSDTIQQAISDAGATLIVLDAGDPGMVEGDALLVDGLQRILRNNLAAISAVLNP